ncbi:flagellar biosynthetic protein FliR [Buchnera aphidicola]|uniref:flagellar biosynthetic protein FliR n=1 Tax=Buchnera aphidicola TaxID=9 RepID=UPI0031B6BFD9
MLENYSLYELLKELNFFIYSLVRIFSFIIIVPILGNKVINYKIKLLFSILISCCLESNTFNLNFSLFSSKGILILIEQILIGMIMGYFIVLIFSISRIAGEIISVQMGLSFSAIFDLNSRLNSLVLSRLISLFTNFLFLSLNGHLIVLQIIIRSFQILPIQNIFFEKKIFFNLVIFFNVVLLQSIMFIFPILISLLLINIIISFLNRICSQLSIFSIGIPTTLIVGIIMLYNFIPIASLVYKTFFFNLLNQL